MSTKAAGPIGILALQGAFAAHQPPLAALGHEVLWVRAALELRACAGLVLPGGESSVQLQLLLREGLVDEVVAFAAARKPVLATCAGLILAAASVQDPEQRSLSLLDVTVRRNAWGRQIASFEAKDDDGMLPVVAIRAPRITCVGPGVEVLATLAKEPIWVRQGSVTGVTFHPELTADLTVHASVFGRGELRKAA